MKNEPQYPPSHIEDSPSYFARYNQRKRESVKHLGERAYPDIDPYAPEPKPCLNFVEFTRGDFNKAEWGRYTPLDLLARMTEHERYELFKYLADLQLSYNSRTFFEQLLKEGLDRLNGEDCEKWLKKTH